MKREKIINTEKESVNVENTKTEVPNKVEVKDI